MPRSAVRRILGPWIGTAVLLSWKISVARWQAQSVAIEELDSGLIQKVDPVELLCSSHRT